MKTELLVLNCLFLKSSHTCSCIVCVFGPGCVGGLGFHLCFLNSGRDQYWIMLVRNVGFLAVTTSAAKNLFTSCWVKSIHWATLISAVIHHRGIPRERQQPSMMADVDFTFDDVCKKGNTLIWDLVQDEMAVSASLRCRPSLQEWWHLQLGSWPGW